MEICLGYYSGGLLQPCEDHPRDNIREPFSD